MELFVAVLGATNYTFAEATRTQTSPDFVSSQFAPSNSAAGRRTRSSLTASRAPWSRPVATTRACSGRTRSWRATTRRRFCRRGRCAARQGQGRSRRAGGGAVDSRADPQRRLPLARRAQRPLRELLPELNARPMRPYKASRRSSSRGSTARRSRRCRRRPSSTRKKVGPVNIDYHVAFEDHFYSAPYPLVHEEVEMRATTTTVEVLHRGRRVAAHLRSCAGRHSTVPEHMPSSHRAHAEWTPSRILGWASSSRPRDAWPLRGDPPRAAPSGVGLPHLPRPSPAREEATATHGSTPRAPRALRRRAQLPARPSILQHNLDREPSCDSSSTEAAAPVATRTCRAATTTTEGRRHMLKRTDPREAPGAGAARPGPAWEAAEPEPAPSRCRSTSASRCSSTPSARP